ncbi:MAG: hypothetical protein ABSA68_13840 [Xanthobacteraceae bacterium]|jgi:hypothetical protein
MATIAKLHDKARRAIAEVPPPPAPPRKYWTRRGIAEWLIETLADDTPTLVGIDHAFSFPRRYFDSYGLNLSWPAFLDDFQAHWPTDDSDTWVRDVLRGAKGKGFDRRGDKSCFRITESRTKTAKSVFNFDAKQGCVAFSSHAGIPWLLFIRRHLGELVHFWPFDGWDIPAGRSAIAEVYPALWNRSFARADRTMDQHDAFCVAAWLFRADLDGSLAAFLKPDLAPPERAWLGSKDGYWGWRNARCNRNVVLLTCVQARLGLAAENPDRTGPPSIYATAT